MLAPLDDDAVMRRVLPAVLVATLGAFSFGYHLGIVNPALEHLAKDLGIAANVQLKGLVVSMVLVGATAGSLVAGKLAMASGVRRRSSASPRRSPSARSCVRARPNVETMLVGRLLCGLGIGASSNLVPMYIAEVSPEKVRVLGLLNQLGICLGILVAVIAGLPLARDPMHRHAMFLYAVAPAAAQFFFMSVVPESPVAARRGKVSRRRPRRPRCGARRMPPRRPPPGTTRARRTRPSPSYSRPANRKQITIGTTLFFLQQMTGINAVILLLQRYVRSRGSAERRRRVRRAPSTCSAR